MQDITARGKIPFLLVGGTMLYFNSLLRFMGWPSYLPVDYDMRNWMLKLSGLAKRRCIITEP
ncbi:MAG: hypothetical protein H0A75_05500 [Candidatus Methanofishera endochildressiae]|uniref:Uncharacterized protein n=1 Tax=Candidatus Methanofishera endochildressiae TaxID=2738884 RepID=A0A7Z0MPF0_9GAMM|nr:hypothetical protein [Candidatus Methanofishera endochildressiae]